MPGLPQATYISLAVPFDDQKLFKLNFLCHNYRLLFSNCPIIILLNEMVRRHKSIHQTYLCVFVLPANRELRIATDKPHCVWCNPRSIFYQMIHGLDASTLEDICRQYAPALCPFHFMATHPCLARLAIVTFATIRTSINDRTVNKPCRTSAIGTTPTE